jgi:diguanylate cyclase (GGDEF)-like protein
MNKDRAGISLDAIAKWLARRGVRLALCAMLFCALDLGTLARAEAPAPAGAQSSAAAQPAAAPATAPVQAAAAPAALSSDDSLGSHLLPGLLLGLLLGLAALHLARQVYIEAPGSLAAAGLLAMAFFFEYVSFGLHVPLVGSGHRALFVEAFARAGLVVAALTFLSAYLELTAVGGVFLWGTWGILFYALFTALLSVFNAALALMAGQAALAGAALWAVILGFALGRKGDGRASYLVPGLLLILASVVIGGLSHFGLIAGGMGLSLTHALFVIGLLLVAFAVESVEAPPERSLLALPAPASRSEAAGLQPAAAADKPKPDAPPRTGPDLVLARISERRLALALAASRHGLWDWNVAGGRIAISPETENLLGLDAGSFDGGEETWVDRIHPDDREAFRSEMARAVGEGEGNFDLTFRLTTEEGETRWAMLNGSCLNPGPDGRASRCIGLITERSGQVPAAAAKAAGAPADKPVLGRGALLQTLDDRLSPKGKPENGCWLLMLIDLDRFHAINEGFGHETGDRVLEVIAGRLKAGLGESETLLRLGGDEYGLILHDGLGKPPRGVRADRLISLIGRHIPLDDGREVFTSASIGVLPLDGEVKSGAAALKDAESALYHVKRTGGGRYTLFSPDMREKSRSAASLESELRRALEREEIELHYQPIMALADGRISGFEALIRWRHTEHGILTAESFIDIAEKTGLIVPLGKYALAMASVQLFQWQSFYQRPQPLFVCVNVSSRQLLRHDLVKDVRDVLAAVSLAPGSLRLEVSEQLIADDAAGAKTVLDEIKALGAGIALDDFGTGYASLGVLQQLPIDTIKVDKSFIARLREPAEKPVVVRSIVDLAHDLDMDVIAEGIESEADVRRLRALGCEFGQGFYFGSPMPPDDIQGFISRHWSN